MSFHVGQKVVCIHDRPTDHIANGQWLDGEAVVRGRIYTIRSIHLDERGANVLWLHEVRRGPSAVVTYGPLVGYGAYRFRPVQTRSTETGMSILRKVAADAAKRRNLVVTR